MAESNDELLPDCQAIPSVQMTTIFIKTINIFCYAVIQLQII